MQVKKHHKTVLHFYRCYNVVQVHSTTTIVSSEVVVFTLVLSASRIPSAKEIWVRRRHRAFLWLDAEAMSLVFLLDIHFIHEITTDRMTAKDIIPTKVVNAPRSNQWTEQASTILKIKNTNVKIFKKKNYFSLSKMKISYKHKV